MAALKGCERQAARRRPVPAAVPIPRRTTGRPVARRGPSREQPATGGPFQRPRSHGAHATKSCAILCAPDSGSYCNEAVEAYKKAGTRYIVSARKTCRLVDELKASSWTGSPKTDADAQCEFPYQPEGWSQEHRFIALRYIKKKRPATEGTPGQYQLFDTAEYSYRVFVTNMSDGIAALAWFYSHRAGRKTSSRRPKTTRGWQIIRRGVGR
jgi:hypothetical protein